MFIGKVLNKLRGMLMKTFKVTEIENKHLMSPTDLVSASTASAIGGATIGALISGPIGAIIGGVVGCIIPSTTNFFVPTDKKKK